MVKDTYCAFATQGNDKDRMMNVQVATSEDLFNCKYNSDALPQKPVWADHTQDFWAPHVLYDSSLHQQVLFYCAKRNDTSFDKYTGVAFLLISILWQWQTPNRGKITNLNACNSISV